MKKLIKISCLLISSFGLLAFTSISASAKEPKDLAGEYKKATTQEERMAKLRELGTSMIDKRLDSLDQVRQILTEAMKISETTRTGLLSRIENNISSLNALKTEIEQESDLAVLKDKVRSIITGYRIYVVFLPQTRGLAAVDRLRTYQEKLDSWKAKISEKITAARTAGYNVSEIETKLTAATDNLAAGASKLESAERNLSAMSIERVAESRAYFLNGKTNVREARGFFHEARQQLRSAVNSLKQLVGEKGE